MLFGIIAIIAGVAAILSPFSTQVIFIVLMSISLLIASIVQLIHTIRYTFAEKYMDYNTRHIWDCTLLSSRIFPISLSCERNAPFDDHSRY